MLGYTKSTPAHVVNPCLARNEEIIGRGVGGCCVEKHETWI